MLKLVRIVAIGLLLGAAPLAIAQENFSANDIVDALTPKEKTRGLTVTETNIDEAPSISMRVQFAYDSDELENEAILAMRALGAALRDERLKDYRFQIIGHTDAKGSDAYNLELSKRRAAAVVEHLVFFHNVDAGRLVAIGMGETDPTNTADPDAAENRRVEIINIGS
ncbi:MAG: OmpA family protein [Devosia sp.]|jgi:outer membrane protein OmpA-like peptidoglycan-associated protein|nr:OmpA family protein [Devosia sp.]